MPSGQEYTVKDTQTGKTVTFRWNEATPPTEADMAEVFAASRQTPAAAPAAKPSTSILDLGVEAVSRYAKGVVPVDLLKQLYGDVTSEMSAAVASAKSGDMAGAVGHAVTASPLGQGAKLAGQLGQAQLAQFGKAKDAYDKGDLELASAYTVAGFLPLVGPAATAAGEEVRAGRETGDVKRQVGAVFELGGMLTGPSLVKGVLPKSVRIPGTGKFANVNPAEVAAVQYGERAGIPIDAATATGSRVVRGAQYAADYSLGGALEGARAAAAQTRGLAGEAANLERRASPAPVSPESAGAGVRQAVGGEVSRLHGEASQAYGDLRAIEQQGARPVQVGTNPDGTPVMETMGMPVDLRASRSVLRPIYDRLMRKKELTGALMGDEAKAATALDGLMTGPHLVPASLADEALSDLKSLSRFEGMPELRGTGKGLAAVAVRELETQVQQAVSLAGPQATAARNAGRAATKAKYTAGDVLDDLKTEPVRAYRQATQADDLGIDYLRQLKQHAPAEMPKVGRALLTDLFDKARAEGGFKKADKIFSEWQKVGPETKKTLFPDAALRSDLDNFFLLQKKMAENPNPSGSALVGSLTAQGWLLLNPVSGAKVVLGGAALGRLLHSKAGIKALTEVVRIPTGRSRLAQAAAISRVGALAGVRPSRAGVPVTAEDEAGR